MDKRLQLSVLCGGQSPEHQISIRSAVNIVSALDQKKYDISLVYIDAKGAWFRLTREAFLAANHSAFSTTHQGEPITVELGASAWLSLQNKEKRYPIDCVFPVLHGANGEDGVMQGFLELTGLPYVGCNLLSSAVCMNKAITKRILRSAGLPVVDWWEVYQATPREGLYDDIVSQCASALIVKPASTGSSVGINKVKDEAAFLKALDEAFQYDACVIVEPCVVGREIECAVLGNDHPAAAKPGEVLAPDGFYSYFEKYNLESKTNIEVPARLSADAIAMLQELAIQAFKTLGCSGLARVDFFLLNDEEAVINELNTIPGFTNISMYPKMWEVSGLPYSDLVDQLIELALEQHRMKEQLTRAHPMSDSAT